jgi:hypothetical protein
MKVIQLPDVVHDYLVHVLEQYAGRGIHPEEGLALSSLWELCVKKVQSIDDAAIQKMAAAAAPSGQSAVPNPPVEPSNIYPEGTK